MKSVGPSVVMSYQKPMDVLPAETLPRNVLRAERIQKLAACVSFCVASVDSVNCAMRLTSARFPMNWLSVVLGVSTQDNSSHRAFASKYGLPFMLLPDEDHAIAKAFGVPVKNGYAKRVTFVIDKQGKIAKVFPEVNPKGHSEEILEALRSLT